MTATLQTRRKKPCRKPPSRLSLMVFSFYLSFFFSTRRTFFLFLLFLVKLNSKYESQLKKMAQMHNVPSDYEKFKSFVVNSFHVKQDAEAQEIWRQWNAHRESLRGGVVPAPRPPGSASSDSKECANCGKKFITSSIARHHETMCVGGQLGEGHSMPLRTVQGPGKNGLILAGDKAEMKELYKVTTRDPSRIPTDFAKFKDLCLNVHKSNVSAGHPLSVFLTLNELSFFLFFFFSWRRSIYYWSGPRLRTS